MRLWTLSDLHLNTREAQNALVAFDRPQADLRVVAGDVCEGGALAVRYLSATSPGVPTVFVLGNHEFYGGDVETEVAEAKKAAQGTDVHVLEEDAVVLGGTRFLGCTLWTDYALYGRPREAMMLARDLLDDHRYVDAGPVKDGVLPSLFRPKHALEIHKRSRAWLARALAEPFDGPTVVVTHHAPHPCSVAEEYRGDAMTPAFVSDLSPLFEAGPDVWIHGHTHASFAYEVQKTRVFCNPWGYAKESPDFDPELVVEVNEPGLSPSAR